MSAKTTDRPTSGRRVLFAECLPSASATRDSGGRVLAIGCLIPVILVAVGAVAGGAIGGQHDALLGAIGGAVIGLIVMIGLAWGWARITSRRF